MFSNKTTIERLTTEVLINITSFLDVQSILQLSLTSKTFSHLIKDELVFRQLTKRDFYVTAKEPDQSWVDLYKEKRSMSVEEQVTETNNLVTEQDTSTQDMITDSIITHEEGHQLLQETVHEQVTVQEEEVVAAVKEEKVATQEEKVIAQEEENISQEPEIKYQEEEAKQKEEATPEEEATREEEATPEEEATREEEATQQEAEATQEEEFTQEDMLVDEEPVENHDIPVKQETLYNEHHNNDCPHLNQMSDSVNEIKKILYKRGNQSLCDLCSAQTASYLNMSDNCHYEACRYCLETNLDDEEHFPIQLELATGDMYCFKCDANHPRKVNDSEKVKNIVEYIQAPPSSDDLDKRRKAEHQLYVQELRREDMSLKHYLVEKQWGRTWMLFRTREGSPLPGKITNSKLARSNGTLDPNIRLPMDKFRPSPETHADIVSERLWSYLVKAYGVQGRAYSEDDIIAPEYARLRVYVDDFKKSINLYP